MTDNKFFNGHGSQGRSTTQLLKLRSSLPSILWILVKKQRSQWLGLFALLMIALTYSHLASAQLSCQALLSQAPISKTKNLILVPNEAPNFYAAHQAITADLFNGEIIEFKPFSQNDNKHHLFLVKIRHQDPKTGEVRYRTAFFKPRVHGDDDGYARAPMEYVAYFLNLKLDMDYVPPTAYRRGLHLEFGGQIFTEGSFILRAPNFDSMASLPHESYPSQHEQIISDNRVLNVLLKNKDGHYWNLGLGSHWVDGNPHPVFIDWGAGLRQGTNVSMTNYPAYGNSRPVQTIRRRTFEALKKLTHEDLKPLIDAWFISYEERQEIMQVRDGIVNYFQGLVDQAITQGRSADDVLITP